LVTKVARHGNRHQFPKEAFTIDLEAMSCTCPAGQGIAGHELPDRA
jgi:hypothetical protein